MMWKKIGTAPTSGGPAFLVWLRDEQFATLAHWRTHDYGETDLYLPAMDEYADAHIVTHWMPLPDPPPPEE